MSMIWDWISQNKEWIFSGIGVLVIGTIVSLIWRSKRHAPQGDQIVTHGDQSPGKVGGDYKATKHEGQ